METLYSPHYSASCEQRHFCSRCGTALVLRCSHCEFGKEPVNQVEYRYLTTMFCDLVNSTGLAAKLDPEELLQIIQAYRYLCVAIIKNYGGFVGCQVGDGIMSYFGYPRAHGDDAERAAHAALDLIASIKNRKTGLADVPGNRLSIRIGIASGLVVAGNLTGTGIMQQETVVGEAPNLAARLQALAQPDTVVVSTETRNLIQNRFRLKNIGFHRIPGFEKTHRPWQVVDAAGTETRLHGSGQTNARELVGRSREFRRLTRYWNQAQRHEGRIVLVCGEAGVGKSKLLETLGAHVSRESPNRFIYRCSPLHPNDTVNLGLARLQASVGLSAGGSAAGKISTEKPVDTEPCLIILEDAHWINSVSMELLNKLIPEVRGKPVLLAISHRLHFKPPALWFEQDHVEEISLSPLPQPAAELFINRIIGERRVPAQVISRIIAASDGIPFFLEELTRTALQTQFAGNRELQPLPGDFEIPKKIRTVLMARLDRHASSREAAQIGAALGREFSYGLLTRIWTHEQSKLDYALHSLCTDGLLVKTGDADNVCYRFKWILMREVAYQSILMRVRQRLHGRITRVIEEHYPEYARLHPALLLPCRKPENLRLTAKLEKKQPRARKFD